MLSDIPVLIIDNANLVKNKDVDIIPRLYSKYAHKKKNIPFLFYENRNKYGTLNKYFRNHFLPKERLLMGQYSSDLTNPFRINEANVDYLCK